MIVFNNWQIRLDGYCAVRQYDNLTRKIVVTGAPEDWTWDLLVQAEANIRDLNAHPPIPGEAGLWMVWNLAEGRYEESGLPLPEMPQGPQGEQGPQGDPGPQGVQGSDGVDGKSASASALDGGYTGSEEDFQQALAGAAVSTVTFSSGNWSKGTGGLYTLTLPKSQHGRASGSFVYTVWHLQNERYLRNTWALLATEIRYDAVEQMVILESGAAFDGMILFMG